ncbi:hypothetical protein QJS04_geneDACA015427 [Acorus gramineus]|uniref:Uncharacterized protein n=1 Tax=Acorus gramineus TaxID=55184 RepID=A0AAV9A4W8_ACOGR|nr:hypothetical protein QJS04_geneDACA015427 [Acorus gramineus]
MGSRCPGWSSGWRRRTGSISGCWGSSISRLGKRGREEIPVDHRKCIVISSNNNKGRMTHKGLVGNRERCLLEFEEKKSRNSKYPNSNSKCLC